LEREDGVRIRLCEGAQSQAGGRQRGGWKDLLTEDAVLISDGGGKRKAALRPMVGRDDVIALISGLAWRGSIPMAGDIRLARINGAFGVVLRAEGEVVTIAFEPGEPGKLAAIYMVRNPDKLGHVARG
jgi:RNA polymerase sigma-70 factor (ECF subfamily)